MVKGREALEDLIRKIIADDGVKFKDIKIMNGPVGFYTVCWEKTV